MNAVLYDLIKDTPLPRMIPVRQHFDHQEIGNVEETLRDRLQRSIIQKKLRPGMNIAVGVGSRGIAQLPLLVSVTVDELKRAGTLPFIVPAMGSHGGACDRGQKQMLAELGVTEESAGCSILSSMETVEIGRLQVDDLPGGVPVYMDRLACEADGIAAIARVKPHTGFRGPCESGMAKMLAVGFGKQKGANVCHQYTYRYMSLLIQEMARMKIEKNNVLFEVGVVENAFDRLCEIEAVPGEEIVVRDAEMLVKARERMARLLFDRLDVLIVTRIGKNISGDGMDPNITGRWLTSFASGGPQVGKIGVLDLTDQTHGNAVGIGGADLISRRVFEKMDLEASYANALTTTNCSLVKIPMMMDTDRQVLLAAVNTCNGTAPVGVRMALIQDTAHMENIYVSEGLLKEVTGGVAVEQRGPARELAFGRDGSLILEFEG